MRGDRPDTGATGGRRVWATPHARGSTPYRERLASMRIGYPACAGIDPVGGDCLPAIEGLPRMRGDRPLRPATQWKPGQATPHARGSTRSRRLAGRRWPGYPACAGIDPQAGAHAIPSMWLPRMRGDRPAALQLYCSHSVATPHARGSTSAAPDEPWHANGYPACAGIDPIDPISGSSPLRLPRMRGDRPAREHPRALEYRATPHARGST